MSVWTFIFTILAIGYIALYLGGRYYLRESFSDSLRHKEVPSNLPFTR